MPFALCQIGVRTLGSLLEERRTAVRVRAKLATAPFRSLLDAVSKQLEAVRACAARSGQSDVAKRAKLSDAKTDFADLQALVISAGGVSDARVEESTRRTRLEHVCSDLQSLYRTIWKSVGAVP